MGSYVAYSQYYKTIQEQAFKLLSEQHNLLIIMYFRDKLVWDKFSLRQWTEYNRTLSTGFLISQKPELLMIWTIRWLYYLLNTLLIEEVCFYEGGSLWTN